MNRLFLPTLMLSLALLTSCDRNSQTSSGTNTTDPPAPIRLSLQLTAITPLLPDMRTHIAVDSRGNLYWLQESDSKSTGSDLVYAMGDSGVPESIPALTIANILAACGRTDVKAATCAIRAMAAGPDDQLYFFFSGGSGRSTLKFLARYAPKTRRMQIVADAPRLMAASGLGASIELARPELVSSGNDLWLWLRHTDQGAVLKLEIKPDVVELRPLELKAPDIGPAASIKLRLTSEEDDLSAGPQQTLYYIDRAGAILWKIDAAGEYSKVLSLETFSSALTPAAVTDDGQICLLAGDGPRLHGRSSSFDPTPELGSNQNTWSRATFPAFLEIKGDKAHLIPRDDLSVPVKFPVQNLQPHRLLYDRATGTMISFDAATGEIIRMKLVRY